MHTNRSRRLLTTSTWVMGLLTIFCIILTGFLTAFRRDLESFLYEKAPGNHMPDAFSGLNEALPVFCLLVTATSVLALKITVSQQYLFLAPLIAGPVIGAAGWSMTENYQDPNWFHLIAFITIGMFVSCLVTAMLIVLRKRDSLQSTLA